LRKSAVDTDHVVVMGLPRILKVSNPPAHALAHKPSLGQSVEYSINRYLIEATKFLLNCHSSEWLALPLKKLQYPKSPWGCS